MISGRYSGVRFFMFMPLLKKNKKPETILRFFCPYNKI